MASTGTVTERKPRLTAATALGTLDDRELLRLAASLERASEHPLAAAIVAGAEERGLALAAPSEFHAEPGKGASGVVEGRRIAVGNQALFEVLGIDPDGLPERADELRRDGRGAMLVAIDGKPAGLLAVADPIKEGAREALAALRDEGIRVVMLTGDSRVTAEAVARRLGIEEVIAAVLPDEKAAAVKRLQQQGRCVAMG